MFTTSRNSLFAFALVCLMLSATGCHKAVSPIVGKWVQTKSSPVGVISTTYDFRDNGTIETTIMIGKSGSAVATGTYTYTNNIVTLKYASAVVKRAGTAPVTQSNVQSPPPATAAIKGNTLTLTGAHVETLTRAT